MLDRLLTCTCAPDDDDRPPERAAFTTENVERYLAAAEEAGIERARLLRARLPVHRRRSRSGATRSGRSRRATTWTPTASSCARPRCGSGSRSTSCPAREDRIANLLDGRDFDYVRRLGPLPRRPGRRRRRLRHLGDGRRPRRGLAPLLRGARRGGRAAGCSTSSPTPTWSRCGARAGPRPERDPRFYYEPAVEAIAEAGIAVEVSTAGLRKPVGEIYPAPAFAEMCVEAGAAVRPLLRRPRRPRDVGHAYETRGRRRCAAGGSSEIAVFERRERRLEPLG